MPQRVENPQLLFVYGLLMRGLELNVLLAKAEFIDEASIPGILVSLGSYPGLIEGEGIVHGEVYALKELDSGLAAIDAAEEYDPQNPEQSLYRRVARYVHGARVGDVLAWVYLYNGSRKDLRRLASGDWRCQE